jgi:gas vesicle protein
MHTEDHIVTVYPKANLIFGLLAGAAIGAALGMLFTPHKGSVLRSNLRRRGEQLSDEALETIGDHFDEITDRVADKLHTLKNDLTSTIHSRMCE